MSRIVVRQEAAGVTARALSAGADDRSRMRAVAYAELEAPDLSRAVRAPVPVPHGDLQRRYGAHAAPPDGPEPRTVFTGGTIRIGSPTSVGLPHGDDDQVVDRVSERVTSLSADHRAPRGRRCHDDHRSQRAADACAGVTTA